MTRLPAGVMREATIDVGAIEDNVRHLRRLTESEVIAVVKADGYGHGAVRSAAAALRGGASRLGVADIGEAIALRRAGIDAPIVAWLHAPGTSFAEAASHGIELGISSFEQLGGRGRGIRRSARGRPSQARDGSVPQRHRPRRSARRLRRGGAARRIGRLRAVALFSHLSNASADDDRAALRAFEDAVGLAATLGLAPPLRHLAATHAAIDLPESRLGLRAHRHRHVRPLAVRRPQLRRSRTAAGDDPARSGRRGSPGAGGAGRVVRLRLPHGARHHARARSAGIRGRRAAPGVRGGVWPAVGACRRRPHRMDQFVVDVGDDPAVADGDEVVLFGDPRPRRTGRR